MLRHLQTACSQSEHCSRNRSIVPSACAALLRGFIKFQSAVKGFSDCRMSQRLGQLARLPGREKKTFQRLIFHLLRKKRNRERKCDVTKQIEIVSLRRQDKSKVEQNDESAFAPVERGGCARSGAASASQVGGGTWAGRESGFEPDGLRFCINGHFMHSSRSKKKWKSPLTIKKSIVWPHNFTSLHYSLMWPVDHALKSPTFS
jgi:hypothetical protein